MRVMRFAWVMLTALTTGLWAPRVVWSQEVAPSPNATSPNVTGRSKPTNGNRAVQGAPEQVYPPRKGEDHGKDHKGSVATFVGFTLLPNGASRIFVDFTGPVQVTEERSQGALAYVFPEARVGVRNNQNALETGYYDTPIVRAKLNLASGTKRKKQRGQSHRNRSGVELQIALRAAVSPSYRLLSQAAGGVQFEVTFPAGFFAREATGEAAPASIRGPSGETGAEGGDEGTIP